MPQGRLASTSALRPTSADWRHCCWIGNRRTTVEPGSSGGMNTTRFSIGWTACLVLLGAGLPGCDSTAPNVVPQERFGQIQVRVRDQLWLGDFGPDSVIGRYNPLSGRLDLFATGRNRRGREQSVAISLCTQPGQDSYSFAGVNRGPYGLDAYRLGAIGTWREPIRPKPWGVEYWTLISAGGPRDSIVFDALQPWYARGRFRFRAATFDESEEVIAEGRFFGRLERHSGDCPPP